MRSGFGQPGAPRYPTGWQKLSAAA